jgi:hypothetical protein
VILLVVEIFVSLGNHEWMRMKLWKEKMFHEWRVFWMVY